MPAGRLCVPGVQAPLPDPSGKANVDKRGDYVAVGCRRGSSLREVGITADKALSAAYGLIFKPEIVSEARELAAQLRETRP